jgi:hypothetical protein
LKTKNPAGESVANIGLMVNNNICIVTIYQINNTFKVGR